jgi:hypothetical protein
MEQESMPLEGALTGVSVILETLPLSLTLLLTMRYSHMLQQWTCTKEGFRYDDT